MGERQCEGTGKSWPSADQEESSEETKSATFLTSRLSGPQNYENKFPLLKPPRRWCPVMAALAD